MRVKLQEVVPWGRSMWEYAHMFDLSDADLATKHILGVGDGPASFNAEMRERGRRVVSCDPIYFFTGEQIRSRVWKDILTAGWGSDRHGNDDHIRGRQAGGRIV